MSDLEVARVTYRGTYGGRPCTYVELPNRARGSTPNPADIGEPALKCTRCNSWSHTSNWACESHPHAPTEWTTS